MGQNISENSAKIYHPVSTGKVGGDEIVVLIVHLGGCGLSGLQMVDASIIPTVTSGNTYASTIIVGEKTFDTIKEGSR